MILTFRGCDDWDRPVYENNGSLYVDVNPIVNRQPEICTKVNNEFYGEPDSPVNKDFEFVPRRVTW